MVMGIFRPVRQDFTPYLCAILNAIGIVLERYLRPVICLLAVFSRTR